MLKVPHCSIQEGVVMNVIRDELSFIKSEQWWCPEINMARNELIKASELV